MNQDVFRMVRGDAAQRLRQLGDASVDSFVTDPPFGINLRLGTRKSGTRSIAGDRRGEAIRIWRRCLPEMARVARPNTLHVVFADYRSPWAFELLAKHFRVVDAVCWDKVNIALGHYLRRRWELAYLIAKGSPPRRSRATPNVWAVQRVHRPSHPCEKPVALLRMGVELCTGPGDLVCDPFAGIGSTGVAAVEAGRRFLGVEIDPRHCAVAETRVAAALNKQEQNP